MVLGYGERVTARFAATARASVLERAAGSALPSLVALVLGGATIVALEGDADACTCVTPKPLPLDAKRKADAVFEGRAYGQTIIGGTTRYSFDVDRYWKGDLPERIEIETRTQSAQCGRSYELGRSYVIYARKNKGRWTDGLCSRTRATVAAAQDLAMLGEGVVPNKDEPDAIESFSPEGDEPLEPPRIDVVPGTPPATAPSKRGCSIDGGTSPEPLTGALLTLLIASGRLRRRSR